MYIYEKGIQSLNAILFTALRLFILMLAVRFAYESYWIVCAFPIQNRLEFMIPKEVGRGLTEFLFSFFYFDVPRCKGQIKSRSLIEPWPAFEIISVRRCCDRIAWCASLLRATGRAGIIPRDFRSVYSLAGHSFLPVTFAAARRGAEIAESADVFLTIAAQGATIIRCQRSRTLVHIGPRCRTISGLCSCVPKGLARSLCNCRIMPQWVRTRSE